MKHELPPNALQSNLTLDFDRVPSLIYAQNDVEAILAWLHEFQDSPNTLAGYRKESERFLLWLHDRGLTFQTLRRSDVLDYKKFLQNPQPASRWIGRSLPRSHPEWKPFSAPLKSSSIHHTFAVLKSLFSYLNHAGYLRGNPFLLTRQIRLKTHDTLQERFFDVATWQWILHYLDTMPRTNPREIAHAERSRWLLILLYLTGARRNEIANARMCDIFIRHDLWWFRVEGKGGKVGEIPVSDELLAALIQYRRSLNLPDLPNETDKRALVGRIGAHDASCMTHKAIYLIVKQIFENAAALAEQHASPDIQKFAPTLRAASTHWMRHTSASHQLERGVPLLVVSKNLRHQSIQTTGRYLHTEDFARHQATQRFTLRPQNNEDIT